MHNRFEVLEHLTDIRRCISRAEGVDVETVTVAVELVDRLALLINADTLSKPTVVLALDAFEGIPGTGQSIEALRRICVCRQ